MVRRARILSALCGLLSVVVFMCSFTMFGLMRSDFDVFHDFISKLGSHGQPYATWWNLMGFASVGLLLAAFGWFFGLSRNDRILGTCLMVAGLGFALAAIPTDFSSGNSPLSRAHYVSICLALAGYCFGLARLTGLQSTPRERTTANWVVLLSILPIVFVSGGVSAEPLAHRVILIIAFTWVVLTSLRLLSHDDSSEFVG